MLVAKLFYPCGADGMWLGILCSQMPPFRDKLGASRRQSPIYRLAPHDLPDELFSLPVNRIPVAAQHWMVCGRLFVTCQQPVPWSFTSWPFVAPVRKQRFPTPEIGRVMAKIRLAVSTYSPSQIGLVVTDPPMPSCGGDPCHWLEFPTLSCIEHSYHLSRMAPTECLNPLYSVERQQHNHLVNLHFYLTTTHG